MALALSGRLGLKIDEAYSALVRLEELAPHLSAEIEAVRTPLNQLDYAAWDALHKRQFHDEVMPRHDVDRLAALLLKRIEQQLAEPRPIVGAGV
jgi:hypothetical protein